MNKRVFDAFLHTYLIYAFFGNDWCKYKNKSIFLTVALLLFRPSFWPYSIKGAISFQESLARISLHNRSQEVPEFPHCLKKLW